MKALSCWTRDTIYLLYSIHPSMYLQAMSYTYEHTQRYRSQGLRQLFHSFFAFYGIRSSVVIDTLSAD